MKIKFQTCLTMMLLGLLISSCNKNSDNSTSTPELSLSAATLTYSEKDSSQTIQVTTNASNYDVVIPSGVTWCSFQKNGNNVIITVTGMSSVTPQRNTTVTVSAVTGSQRVQKIISISQIRLWKLVWEDNFDTNGPVNNNNWTLVNRGTSDWNQYMTPSNELAYVQNGNLILKGRKTAAGYETGGVNSSNKFNFKYGKVEVKAKLSAGQGTWPAIWMMPQQSVYGGWPKSGEIDIMEHLNNDTKIYQVVHSHYVDNLGNKTDPPYVATPNFNVGVYNTFGIEWFPEKIDFLLNGTVTFTYPRKANLPPDQLQWPFDQSFYLILNQALGGSWVGSINDAILPVQTEIDYVKVYGLSVY